MPLATSAATTSLVACLTSLFRANRSPKGRPEREYWHSGVLGTLVIEDLDRDGDGGGRDCDRHHPVHAEHDITVSTGDDRTPVVLSASA